MNSKELGKQLLSQYNIGSRATSKNGERREISTKTLRTWASQGLISRTWLHDGKRGRPQSEFPKRAIAEAAALWAIKNMKLLKRYPTKEDFNRFLHQVGLVYSHYNTGARLALHDVETKKGLVSLFVPFNDATFNASPVLNKLLVAKVVIILEKAKRRWPLDKEARVVFDWRLDSIPQTHSIMGKAILGIKPLFTRKRIRLEEANQNQLVYYLLPCDWWPFGKIMLTVSDDGIVIDPPHPLLEWLEPSKNRQSRQRRHRSFWRRKARHWRERRWRSWRCADQYWREGRWRSWRCIGRHLREGGWRVWRRKGWRCGGRLCRGRRRRGWPREDQASHQDALRANRSKGVRN